MSYALPSVSRQGPQGDVWDVWKRPRTRLERPVPTGLLREMRLRVATRLVRRGRLGRLKSSQVVPRRGLEVPEGPGVIERDVT
jgi:hypothetical protein